MDEWKIVPVKGVKNAVRFKSTISREHDKLGRRYFDVTGHIKHPGYVDAYVENAVFDVVFYKRSDRHLCPFGFVFLSGVWKSGVWENGTWDDGIWMGGEWRSGNIRSIYENEINELLNNHHVIDAEGCINPGEAYRGLEITNETRYEYKKVEKEVDEILAKGKDPRENIICDSKHLLKAAMVAEILNQKMLFEWSEDLLNKVKENYIVRQRQLIEELEKDKNKLFLYFGRIGF